MIDTPMARHSDEAWEIAAHFSDVLASDTRTLAAMVDRLIAKKGAATYATDVYVIRDKQTGVVMPVMPTGGYSTWEPLQYGGEAYVPRTFGSAANAKKAVALWARGVSVPTYAEDPSGDTFTGNETIPQGRDADTLEVVPAVLRIPVPPVPR